MKAIILAGGLGTRLKPFTDIIPKPLLPLGDKSLMEVQINHLKKCGFEDLFIATNYKSDMIKSFLGSGEKYGVSILFSEEKKPLGTCGPITLLKEKLQDGPFLLINGDILTKLNFKKIFDFCEQLDDSPITIGTKIVSTPFQFGKIKSKGNYILDVEEKPDFNFEILAGIYCMKPQIFKYIPEDEYFGIDTLIKNLLAQNINVSKYLIEDYWIDIGAIDDYEDARKIYHENFHK
tara:strand:- start:667 stop:1368 length:702 start_codon:yes stop_codon:yes gene_type:complete